MMVTKRSIVLIWLKKLYRLFYTYVFSDKYVIKKRFRKAFNYSLNLKEPVTLNEKMQWLKLNERSSLQTICADKYLVREYVASHVGENYLIPLYLYTTQVDELNSSSLPNDYSFIIKATHDSSGGVIVKNKDDLDYASLRENFAVLLKRNYYRQSKEWPYKNIKPGIIVEKLLVNEEGDIPIDYKIHCFNGKAKLIGVDIDRFTEHKRNFYDCEWNLLPFTWSSWREGAPLWRNGGDVSPPTCLNEMLMVAEKLSSPFNYARIDLYALSGKIYFGEITFYHGSGFEKFFPPKWDKYYGDILNVNK